ncbi:outer membrane protein assembly factor BamB family protein [Cellulomonas biazotea]|uniref:Pyrrolo-quinoline quinone repeat domain-containing protein n=1 Tax=Cellulomonas biazotea TaxID=1709 RepID=A0A402DSV7_9CELL|nr:PQQ-binding-like beta-propeller repeat protein [Cellulomonas biazotea]GCE77240.1 hypothetical protein CBZ_22960 [Cellulomonas biazotea]
MPSDQRLTPVRLVDDADPVDPVESPSRRPGRRPARRLLRWAWVPVVVAAALVGVQVLLDARADAADAAIAALPGAVADVGDELTTLWVADPAEQPAPLVAVDGGVLALVRRDATPTLTSRDLDTGEERWAVPLGDAVPDLAQQGVYGLTRCSPPAGSTETGSLPDVVVCVASDGYQHLEGDQLHEQPATWSRVTVVDARDGTVRARHDVDPVRSTAVLEDRTVLVRRDAEGGVELVAVDTMSGEERWRHVVPDAAPAAQRRDGTASGPVAWSAGGGVVVALTRQHLVGFTAAGESFSPDVLDDALTSVDGWLVSRAEGGLRRVARAGLPDLVVPGDLARRTVDDGSAPGLEVSPEATRTSAWDGRTGAARWTADVRLVGATRASVLVAEGRLHGVTEDAAVALDAATGEVLWSTPLPPGDRGAVLTDGPHVLVLSGTDGGTDAIAVLDRRTGAMVRQVALPADAVVWPLGDVFLATSPEGYRVLG